MYCPKKASWLCIFYHVCKMFLEPRKDKDDNLNLGRNLQKGPKWETAPLQQYFDGLILHKDKILLTNVFNLQTTNQRSWSVFKVNTQRGEAISHQASLEMMAYCFRFLYYSCCIPCFSLANEIQSNEIISAKGNWQLVVLPTDLKHLNLKHLFEFLPTISDPWYHSS